MPVSISIQWLQNRNRILSRCWCCCIVSDEKMKKKNRKETYLHCSRAFFNFDGKYVMNRWVCFSSRLRALSNTNFMFYLVIMMIHSTAHSIKGKKKLKKNRTHANDSMQVVVAAIMNKLNNGTMRTEWIWWGWWGCASAVKLRSCTRKTRQTVKLIFHLASPSLSVAHPSFEVYLHMRNRWRAHTACIRRTMQQPLGAWVQLASSSLLNSRSAHRSFICTRGFCASACRLHKLHRAFINAFVCVCGEREHGCWAHNFSLFNFVLRSFLCVVLLFVFSAFCFAFSLWSRPQSTRDSRIRRNDILFLRFYPFSWRFPSLSANFKSNCKMINGSLTHTGTHTYAESVCASSVYRQFMSEIVSLLPLWPIPKSVHHNYTFR